MSAGSAVRRLPSFRRMLLRRLAEPVAAPGLVGRLIADPTGRLGLMVGIAVVAAAAVGPALLRTDPNHLDLGMTLLSPRPEHPLGTDQYGRDELARILTGGRSSLAAAALVLGGGGLAGLSIGVAAGLAGGLVEGIVMRLVDVLLAIPDLVIVLAVLGVLGPGLPNLILALSVPTLAFVARLARSCVRNLGSSPVVAAARCAGIAWPRVALGHVVPQAATQVIVVLSMNVGMVLVGIAGLSFLGLGVQQPTPEWGAMLSDGRLEMADAPWLILAPAGAILLTLLSANLVSDALVRLGATGARD